MDSVGIGELPDAGKYGDIGRNTIGNIAKNVKNFSLPNLEKLGLGNICNNLNINKTRYPTGAYGRAMEISPGKDTTTGHWEISGLVIDKPFPLYPNGFPEDIISDFESKIGKSILANKPASGTVIIEEFGDEHIRTGSPIVYTSGDSVFQIAAHENIISVEKLYEMCNTARNILSGEHAVGRVIARPFTGSSGSFKRTSNRKDFSLIPPSKTMLNIISEAGLNVIAVGKIEDIFCGSGITESVHTIDNNDGVTKTIEFISSESNGIIFTNLVDFDSLYGHRNDINGYANCLRQFDLKLPDIIKVLNDDDVLIITADHGNDPTKQGSDHTREYIPILIYGTKIKAGTNIGTRKSFSDIGATITEILSVKKTTFGESFLNQIITN